MPDYDNDGDLDLVTGNWNSGYRLFENQGNERRWLHWSYWAAPMSIAMRSVRKSG